MISSKSYEDWKVVKSNELPHSSFCNHQVPLKERDFSQFVLENGTKLEIQNEKFVVLVLDSLSSANSVQITLKTLSNMVKFRLRKLQRKWTFLQKLPQLIQKYKAAVITKQKADKILMALTQNFCQFWELLRTFLKLSTVFSKNFISHTLSP